MKNTQPDNSTKPFKPDTNRFTLNRLEALASDEFINVLFLKEQHVEW
jgi:hypothetical protein